jgi:hypothetical protein
MSFSDGFSYREANSAKIMGLSGLFDRIRVYEFKTYNVESGGTEPTSMVLFAIAFDLPPFRRCSAL